MQQNIIIYFRDTTIRQYGQFDSRSIRQTTFRQPDISTERHFDSPTFYVRKNFKKV